MNLKNCFSTLIVTVLGFFVSAGAARGEWVIQVLHTATNSGTKFSSLVQAENGYFYGTTPAGAGNYRGTVFQFKPGGSFSNWFYFFTGRTPGSDPQGGLVIASNGDLYGTASSGGAYNQGTVFKISANGWVHSLRGLEGCGPLYSMIQANDGCFYGTANGANGNTGTVFRVTADGLVSHLANLGVLKRATGGLVQGPDGNLYCTAEPTIDLFPPAWICRITTNGATTAFAFTPGFKPQGGLASGTDGCLYGTAYSMTPGGGIVYRVTTNGIMTTFATFHGTNGWNPRARLLRADEGSFYGTTFNGGISNRGTIFHVTTNGTLTTLAHFAGTNGSFPGELMQAADGNLYGTASSPSGAGLIFRLIERPCFTSVARSNGSVVLSWKSFTNAHYRIESAPSPGASSWTALAPKIIAPGNTASFTAPVEDTRSFRLVLLP